MREYVEKDNAQHRAYGKRDPALDRRELEVESDCRNGCGGQTADNGGNDDGEKSQTGAFGRRMCMRVWRETNLRFATQLHFSRFSPQLTGSARSGPH